MDKNWLVIIGFGFALTGASGWSVATETEGYVVAPLGNGINRINLDGKEAMAIIGARENFNAHGFDVATFYVRDGNEWHLVPIFGSRNEKDGGERDSLTVSGGADCALHDFRLLVAKRGRPEMIVKADRDLGASYADPAIVRFTYYELAKNEDGVPGWPRTYFKILKTVVAKKEYCDVNEAIHKELGLSAVGNFSA